MYKSFGGIFMKKTIPIFLIIVGLLFLLTPFTMEQIIKYHNKSIINKEITNETIKANNQNDQLEVEFDFSTIKDVNIKSIIRGSMDLTENLLLELY